MLMVRLAVVGGLVFLAGCYRGLVIRASVDKIDAFMFRDDKRIEFMPCRVRSIALSSTDFDLL